MRTYREQRRLASCVRPPSLRIWGSKVRILPGAPVYETSRVNRTAFTRPPYPGNRDALDLPREIIAGAGEAFGTQLGTDFGLEIGRKNFAFEEVENPELLAEFVLVGCAAFREIPISFVGGVLVDKLLPVSGNRH